MGGGRFGVGKEAAILTKGRKGRLPETACAITNFCGRDNLS
ncbi:hypothetical protein HMPREF9371_1845 [Neisseria shayeganii 871]|uniref:Uncharacterized protein n=1 Tax=Neisseria shayeganii 871 TaxID=1032488 RepID=G4CJQ5_9NEIS|nr:hypothetical protein HMPREF9371_1845 [Neisseria shayeganii 871]